MHHPRPDTAPSPPLQAQCAQCQALCCILPAFDSAQGFGHDKPAHSPCRHLAADRRCRIHDTLARDGYGGCIAFDCFGAGQRTTRLLKLDARWHEQPGAAARVYVLFDKALLLHRLMAGLEATLARLEAGEHHDRVRQRLEELRGMSDDALEQQSPAALRRLEADTRALLRRTLSLQDLLSAGIAGLPG